MGDYSYDNLSVYVRNMTDEAINSAIDLAGWDGSVQDGFYAFIGASGSRVHVAPLASTREHGVTFPGGQITDAGYDSGPNEYGQPLNMTLSNIAIAYGGGPYSNAQEMIDYFTNGIEDLFGPWYSLPVDGGFKDQITACRQAAVLLSPAAASAGSDGDLDRTPDKAELNLHEKLNDLHLSSHDLKAANDDHGGAAMDAFWSTIADPMQLVIPSQGVLAGLLEGLVAAEDDVWKKARDAVADIAGKGVEAMKSARGGGGDLATVLKVLGALALVSAPFTGGLGAIGGLEVEGIANGVGVVA